jgi:hypothetical protein
MPEVPGNWPAVVEALVNSAFQYGPFFFSIWFLYAFARWSYRNYHSILDNPRVDEKERAKHWIFFIGSTIFGCVLVVVSTVWWILNKPNTYVFDGEISGFAESDRVSSPQVYIREALDPSGEMYIYFAAIRDQPFEKRQIFRILVKHSGDEGPAKPRPLLIEYDGHTHGQFSFAEDKLLPSVPPSSHTE